MANSKRKGSKNEREVSKLFQEWTGYTFAKTPQSGGLHWKSSNTSGDIVCTDETHSRRFTLSVECKFHQDLEFDKLINGSYGKGSLKIIEFWSQSLNDAIEHHKIPIVFMRKNLMKKNLHYVIISEPLQKILKEKDLWNPKHGFFIFRGFGFEICIFNSFDLFEIPYKRFYKITRKLLKNGI